MSSPAAAPPDPISPGGRVAAYATAGSVFATSAVYAVVSWEAFACTRRCAVKPAIGGLVFLVSLTAAVAAMALAHHIRRRPVDPEGSSGWSFGVGALFALGAFAAIARIPDMTCPAGSHLSAFAYCSGTQDTRLDPTSWIWVKDALAAAALAVAAMLALARRWASAAATVAVVVWLIGAAMFLGVVF